MTPRDRRTGLAATALAGVSLWLILLAAGGKTPLPLPPAPPVADPSPTPSLAPAASFAAIADRPLFSPSRRPAPPPAAAPPEPVRLPPATLIAVAISPERREAVLKPATGKSVTIYEGGDWQGWTVIGIATDRVRFRSGADEQVLAFPKPTRLQIKAPSRP